MALHYSSCLNTLKKGYTSRQNFESCGRHDSRKKATLARRASESGWQDRRINDAYVRYARTSHTKLVRSAPPKETMTIE